MKKVPYRFYLSEEQIPTQWYNLRADMPEQPDPIINPATMQPATLSDLLLRRTGAPGAGQPDQVF